MYGCEQSALVTKVNTNATDRLKLKILIKYNYSIALPLSRHPKVVQIFIGFSSIIVYDVRSLLYLTKYTMNASTPTTPREPSVRPTISVT